MLVEIPEPGSLKWTDLTVPGLRMALFMEENDVIPQFNQSKKPLSTLGTFFCFLPHCVDVANVTPEISLTFELFPTLHTADSQRIFGLSELYTKGQFLLLQISQ